MGLEPGKLMVASFLVTVRQLLYGQITFPVGYEKLQLPGCRASFVGPLGEAKKDGKVEPIMTAERSPVADLGA